MHQASTPTRVLKTTMVQTLKMNGSGADASTGPDSVVDLAVGDTGGDTVPDAAQRSPSASNSDAESVPASPSPQPRQASSEEPYSADDGDLLLTDDNSDEDVEPQCLGNFGNFSEISRAFALANALKISRSLSAAASPISPSDMLPSDSPSGSGRTGLTISLPTNFAMTGLAKGLVGFDGPALSVSSFSRPRHDSVRFPWLKGLRKWRAQKIVRGRYCTYSSFL
jgi:hypothetical protein